MIYIAVAYVIFGFWVVSDLCKARQSFAKFPPGLSGFGLLMLVAVIGIAAALGFASGKLPVGVYYPIPWLLLAFTPAFVVARRLSTAYETQGTAQSRPLEDICAKVHWLSVFGMVLILFNLLFLWIAKLGAGEMPGAR